MVRQKAVSQEAKQRKEALLAQYANVTDDEEYPLTCARWKEKIGLMSLQSERV